MNLFSGLRIMMSNDPNKEITKFLFLFFDQLILTIKVNHGSVRLIIIKSISIPLEYAMEINNLIELGLQDSFSGFINQSIQEELKKYNTEEAGC